MRSTARNGCATLPLFVAEGFDEAKRKLESRRQKAEGRRQKGNLLVVEGFYGV